MCVSTILDDVMTNVPFILLFQRFTTFTCVVLSLFTGIAITREYKADGSDAYIHYTLHNMPPTPTKARRFYSLLCSGGLQVCAHLCRSPSALLIQACAQGARICNGIFPAACALFKDDAAHSEKKTDVSILFHKEH